MKVTIEVWLDYDGFSETEVMSFDKNIIGGYELCQINERINAVKEKYNAIDKQIRIKFEIDNSK